MTAVTETRAEPATGMTTWERWKGGYPARTPEEAGHYRELDATLTRIPEPRRRQS